MTTYQLSSRRCLSGAASLRIRLGAAGREPVESRYGWDRIRRILTQEYLAIIDAAHAGAGSPMAFESVARRLPWAPGSPGPAQAADRAPAGVPGWFRRRYIRGLPTQ
jgi:hypothetical protein